MKARKTVSLILALLMLLPLVVSCASEQEKNTPTMGEVDIQATYSGQLSTSYTTSDKNGKEDGKNVIVIQLNSVSSVMIDNKYGSAQILPVINELKNNTLYYTDFFAQGSNVLNTEFSVLNSLYAPLDGIINTKYLDNTFNSLPVILKEAGVKNTTAIAANDDRYAQRGEAYKAWGFDNVNLRDGEDDDIFNTAFESIKNSDGNDFCFISTATSVYPYVTSLKGTLNVSTNGPLSAYLNSVNATDKVLGTFFEKLKAYW